MRNVILAMLIVASGASSAGAADNEWQFGSAPSFSSGKYGSSTTTTVVHTPFSVRRLFQNGDLTTVVPFLCVRGDANVTIVNGSPVVTSPGGATRNARGTTPTRSGAATSTPSPNYVNDCGLGDIVVRGRYYIVDEGGWAPTIAVRGHVKAPTASASRGLGTGKPDEGVGVEVSRSIGGRTLVMADAGVTLIGDPSGSNYDNNVWYDVGIGRDLTADANLSVFYEAERSIVNGYADPRDLLAALSVRGPGEWRLQLSTVFGLSDGAPDFGFALGLGKRF